MKAGARTRVLETIARGDLAISERSGRSRDATQTEALARDIVHAVERGQLVLHYQPILDLRTGSCRRVEALLRWQHPRYGLILPGDLLPLADRTGQLGPIGRWVIAEATRQARSWRTSGLGLGIAINLSSTELASLSTLRALMEGLRAHGPNAVSVEIDAAATAHGEVSQATLLRLLSAGARISLDDVGSATMPPAILLQSVDEIKLSRRLVQRATVDREAARELRDLVQRAGDLHLQVVAVGVEDQATRDLVAALGCDYAQGYWISRPLVPHRIAPLRRWFAGAALTGALAFSAEIGTVGASGLGLATACAPAADGSSALVPGLCSVGFLGGGQGAAANLSLARIQERTGLPFVAVPSSCTTLLVDARVEPSTQEALAAATDRDVAQLEEQFGRKFSAVPRIYVFATRSSFALGLEQLFGAPGRDAAVLAATSGGVALPRQGAIVLNLQNTDPTRITIVRHELTHILVHQIAGTSVVLPAWFDEGLATLEQNALTEGDGGARGRAVTLSLLDAKKTTLGELRAPEFWEQRSAALAGQGYTVAAEAVRLLEEQVSSAGLIRMLQATSDGTPFADAFAFETGESIDAFESSFGARLAAATRKPRIDVAEAQGGIVWSFSGVAPQSTVEVRILGSSYHLAYEATTDRYGEYRAAFGSSAPSGDYTIEVTGPEGPAYQGFRVRERAADPARRNR